jgi:hypothetical protein
MQDWKKSFVQKLETAKKQWMHKFEQFVKLSIDPVFHELDEFSTRNGFRVTSPNCEEGTRLFKFALTENGFTLMTFRMRGLEEVQFDCEVWVPGSGRLDQNPVHVPMCDAGPAWVEKQFHTSLDRFVTLFAEAGANSDAVLVKA